MWRRGTHMRRDKNTPSHVRYINVTISGLPHSNQNGSKSKLVGHMNTREIRRKYSKNQIRLSAEAIYNMETFHGGRMGTRWGLKQYLNDFTDVLVWMVDSADVDTLQQSAALLLSFNKVLESKNIPVMVVLSPGKKKSKKSGALSADEVMLKMKLEKCMPKKVIWAVMDLKSEVPSLYRHWDSKTKKYIESQPPTDAQMEMFQSIWQWSLNAKFGKDEFPLPENVNLLPLKEAKDTISNLNRKLDRLEKTASKSALVHKKANFIQKVFRSIVSVF